MHTSQDPSNYANFPLNDVPQAGIGNYYDGEWDWERFAQDDNSSVASVDNSGVQSSDVTLTAYMVCAKTKSSWSFFSSAAHFDQAFLIRSNRGLS
jgi:hypothetical protein